ncbi:unnamed protein product [Pleuronectes platessa]|uniref:Uncharacterized protein n=1 Tax=Pleuronectes platessa TaxID=8262 RepID=A0A9N7VJK5_PLEPL|nr:unnamed protein product [Pleuronectes platessa]
MSYLLEPPEGTDTFTRVSCQARTHQSIRVDFYLTQLSVRSEADVHFSLNPDFPADALLLLIPTRSSTSCFPTESEQLLNEETFLKNDCNLVTDLLEEQAESAFECSFDGIISAEH